MLPKLKKKDVEGNLRGDVANILERDIVVSVVILSKERHGEQKKFDRKTYIFK